MAVLWYVLQSSPRLSRYHQDVPALTAIGLSIGWRILHTKIYQTHYLVQNGRRGNWYSEKHKQNVFFSISFGIISLQVQAAGSSIEKKLASPMKSTASSTVGWGPNCELQLLWVSCGPYRIWGYHHFGCNENWQWPIGFSWLDNPQHKHCSCFVHLKLEGLGSCSVWSGVSLVHWQMIILFSSSLV